MTMNDKIIALHKHWVTADAIKQFMLKTAPIAEPVARLPKAEFQDLAQMQSQTLRMCTFYALIYVVIEGYRDLEKSHAVLDILLAKTDYVDALRRFRNAVFHFQEDPLSAKLLEFLNKKDRELWIEQIYEAFQDLFEEELPVKETLQHLEHYGTRADGA